MPRLWCLLVLCVTVWLALGAPAQGVAASRAIPTATAASTATVASSPSAETATIHITGADQPPGFLPALLSVHVGDSVVFLNDATPAAPYSVAATDHSFTSPPITNGQQWTTTLSTAGVYDYTDPAHTAQMYGELVVVPASVELLPTAQPGAVETAIAQDQAQLPATPVASPTTGPRAVFPGTNLPGFSLLQIAEAIVAGLFIVGAIGFLVIHTWRRATAKPRRKGHP